MVHFKVYDGVADESDCLGEAHIVIRELCRTGLHELDLEATSLSAPSDLHLRISQNVNNNNNNNNTSSERLSNSFTKHQSNRCVSNYHTNMYKNKNTMSIVSNSTNSLLYNTHGVIDVIHDNLDRLLVRSFFGKMNSQVLPPWLSPRSVSHSDYGNELDHNGLTMIDNLFSDDVNLFDESQSSMVNLSHTASVPGYATENGAHAEREQDKVQEEEEEEEEQQQQQQEQQMYKQYTNHENKKLISQNIAINTNNSTNEGDDNVYSTQTNMFKPSPVQESSSSYHLPYALSVNGNDNNNNHENDYFYDRDGNTHIRIGLILCNHLQQVNTAKQVQITMATKENTFTLSAGRLHILGSAAEWDVLEANMEIELNALQESALTIKLSVLDEAEVDEETLNKHDNMSYINDDKTDGTNSNSSHQQANTSIVTSNKEENRITCNINGDKKNNNTSSKNANKKSSDCSESNLTSNNITTTINEKPILFTGIGEIPFSTLQSVGVGDLIVYTATINAETE